ncbi:MAG: DUF2752 domain-containing protein [bacterium]|nr:DUF2752 domain-containing protein [bacterium]
MSFISVEKISSAEAWKIRAILTGILLFGLIISIYYPYNILRFFFPDFFTNNSSCIMLNAFGIPCPFCGMSHALFEMFRFNFKESFYHNPSSVIFFPFLAIISLSIFMLSIFNYKISVRFSRKILFISVLIFLIIWILNIFFGHQV